MTRFFMSSKGLMVVEGRIEKHMLILGDNEPIASDHWFETAGPARQMRGIEHMNLIGWALDGWQIFDLELLLKVQELGVRHAVYMQRLYVPPMTLTRSIFEKCGLCGGDFDTVTLDLSSDLRLGMPEVTGAVMVAQGCMDPACAFSLATWQTISREAKFYVQVPPRGSIYSDGYVMTGVEDAGMLTSTWSSRETERVPMTGSWLECKGPARLVSADAFGFLLDGLVREMQEIELGLFARVKVLRPRMDYAAWRGKYYAPRLTRSLTHGPIGMGDHSWVTVRRGETIVREGCSLKSCISFVGETFMELSQEAK